MSLLQVYGALLYSIPNLQKKLTLFTALPLHLNSPIPVTLEMGLFSSSTPSPALPAPKISSDGAPIAPDRTQRAKCWEARDGYFRCLDKNNIVDSITEHDKAEKGCAKEGREFEGNCASSWVCVTQNWEKREWSVGMMD